MTNNNFQFSFATPKQADELYLLLLDPNNWWNGLFNETIKGRSEKVNDEFSFSAGGGVHFSNQKLVEAAPGKKIVWLVTESNLSFLTKTNEWNNTQITFDIEEQNGKTKVTFTHEGLVPKFECYGGCSSAWTQYLENLKENLNGE